ncbi:MAG: M1 family peptidase [Rhodospirillaceae bacterium]|nr:M1 family peptidase [Rhodospirillaceae bacterium]
MTRALLIVAMCLAAVAAAAADGAPPHHDAEITYRAGGRNLQIIDRILIDRGGRIALRVAPWLTISSIKLGGKPISLQDSLQGSGIDLPTDGPHQIDIAMQGIVPALDAKIHGDIHGAVASDAGLYLPGGSGWLADTGDDAMTYRLTVTTKAPYRAIATGWLEGETATSDGHEVTISAKRPMEPPSLFAGPYRVTERRAGNVRLRTYFHADGAALANTYLDQAARFISDYQRDIGVYPYGDFHIVSAPLPVGLGFPSLTYVGRRVLHLPFMRGRSLAHEVLHSWWGNAVGVDYASGNWAEGLTTYMADHALAGDGGAEMRLGWLRDFAALPENRNTSVRTFVTKTHRATQVIGYGKVAMIFHMLRAEVGDVAFRRAIAAFYKSHTFGTAGWRDIEAAFTKASERDLGWFFAQWLDRPGAPRLELLTAGFKEGRVRFRLRQTTPVYTIKVPVVIDTADGARRFAVTMTETEQEFSLELDAAPSRLRIDPGFEVFRRLLPSESPPILRDVALAANPVAAVVGGDTPFRAAAAELMQRLTDAAPQLLPAGSLPGDGAPALLIGVDTDMRRLAKQLGLRPPPRRKGTACAWADRLPSGQPVYAVAARDTNALKALFRGLPHYGRRSYVVFKGSRAIGKGMWPIKINPLERKWSIHESN